MIVDNWEPGTTSMPIVLLVMGPKYATLAEATLGRKEPSWSIHYLTKPETL